jgi:hypothetical protein
MHPDETNLEANNTTRTFVDDIQLALDIGRNLKVRLLKALHINNNI